MAANSIDAHLLAKMFLAGAKNLDAKKEWINELNVFPVPDGDTGTNMSMTVMSAAREVNAIENMTMGALAKAVSSGSLRGARGNSGVILSQIFRGMTKVIEGKETLNKIDVAEAMEKGCETAYKAVMKPKEGTILTVIRGASKKALELSVNDKYDMEMFIDAIVQEADHVLARTPELLPVLKQAGVVDSGGQGLVQIFKGGRDAYLGKEIDTTIEDTASSIGIMNIAAETDEEIRFGYCTEFIIMLKRPLSTREEKRVKSYLDSVGDSVVMVADDEIVKIHVHTNDPGNVLQTALGYGGLSNIKIDNMRLEHQEKLFKDSRKMAQDQKKAEVYTVPQIKKEVGFIAVAAGDGMEEIFYGLGADVVISGGQTMNPCTEDFLQAIEQIEAKAIFILPNNKNIVLAANQAAALSNDKEVIVIPSKTLPQGIGAMINYIADQSVDENRANMSEMLEMVASGEVTYAIRDTIVDDIEIHEGDYMGIGDDGILAVGREIEDVAFGMTKKMMFEDASIISIYYGEEVSEDQAYALSQRLENAFSECEIDLQYGGQPVYYYIVSVE